jgi:hypothetical protein
METIGAILARISPEMGVDDGLLQPFRNLAGDSRAYLRQQQRNDNDLPHRLFALGETGNAAV